MTVFLSLSQCHVTACDGVPVTVTLSHITVTDCCRYFSVESTQEMLDEWRPLLCLFDAKMSEGLFYLELFLPTVMYPHEYDQGFRYGQE